MKRNLFLTIAISALFAVPSFAAVTIEQTTDAEYIINSGYSQVVAEDVFVQKSRAKGEAIEPLYEKTGNRFVRGWRKFYSYFDPAQESVDRIHHDTKLAPHHSDL